MSWKTEGRKQDKEGISLPRHIVESRHIVEAFRGRTAN